MRSMALGAQGLIVSQIGLGCMNLTGGYSLPPSEADAIHLLHCAVELGITFFDTAEMYGPFQNEIVVGKGLRGLRHRVVISTKFGLHIRPGDTRPTGVDSRPEHIRSVCEASLKRLGVDCIDLFFQHRVDPAVPVEDVAGAVGELVCDGKVRAFGLSEASVETIRRAHRIVPVTAVQTEYSLWSREPEAGLLPTCRELGIGFVAYSPLGRGFLAGAGKSIGSADFRRHYPRWQGQALDQNIALIDRLASIAQDKQCSLAQLSLAWLLHKEPLVAVIPGTNKLSRLEENAAAAIISLSEADIEQIELAVPLKEVAGNRYDDAGASLIET
jgi:aryl-alcohol dehydrogenase-like predicted oxidoreductase